MGLAVEFLTVLAGLAAAAVLFWRIPGLPPGSGTFAPQTQLAPNNVEPTLRTGPGGSVEPPGEKAGAPLISIIIPARNEEQNLPLLLGDLKLQSHPVLEILCVDDGSRDRTGRIALEYDTILIRVEDKPRGWLGKSWACEKGAEASRGEVLLFLDADVRLGPAAIDRLVQAHVSAGAAVSVQPYHQTREPYEQLSMMFNLLQLGSTGVAMPTPIDLGLYGPVILIRREDYWRAGGHAAVRSSIVEDVALESILKQSGIAYRLFLGDPGVSFRMYGGGFGELFEGWTKNLASGAARMPVALFLLVFFWITSMTSVPVQAIRNLVLGNEMWAAVYFGLYLVWVLFLHVTARRIGRFPLWIILLYPLSLALLIFIFGRSLFKKIFHRKVTWKGRDIQTGGPSCD